MENINITPLKDRYILEGWDKLVSFKSFLNIQDQKAQFNICAKGFEIEAIKNSFE